MTPPTAPLVGLLAVLCALLAGCSAPPPPLDLGVVPADCTPERADALAAAGVGSVVLDVAWSRWQPTPATRDDRYVDQVRRRLLACSSRGLRVVLAPGLQYAPAWAHALPQGEYRNQQGDTAPGGPVNLVFSRAVRDAATTYLRDLMTSLPAPAVDAVRVGTSAAGEFGYPGPTDGPTGDGGSFWAFDTAAQSGEGLAAGLTPSPMPGWRPGQASWRGSAVSAAQVAAWFRWYERAIADAAAGQARAVLDSGAVVDVHLVLAGRGATAREVDAAVTDRLGGAGDPEGSLERGLAYPDQIPLLADALGPRLRAHGRRLVADLTGLDDASAAAARDRTPPTDHCRAGDPDVADDPGTESWPSYRFTGAVARRSGLALVGENPGAPSSLTGGTERSDPLAAQLRRAPVYARECGVGTFFFAFEDDLFDGRSGVVPTDLSAARGSP